MKLIGLAGYKGVGKSTVAVSLAKEHNFTIRSFAFPVKMIAARMGWDGVKDEKGRQLLRAIGMSARAYNPDVWVEAALIETIQRNTVFDDVRFKNEADAIRAAGGVVIFLARDGIESDGDPSESFDPAWADLVVHNDYFSVVLEALK